MSNPLLQTPQQKGEVVYFGIHDLAKTYRETGQLPELLFMDIEDKCGYVAEVDPVNQTVDVRVNKPVHLYGYRNLSREAQRCRKYMSKDGVINVTVPCRHLLDISHVVDEPGLVTWLAIDGTTKYQQSLIKAIRRQELRRSEEPTVEAPMLESFDGRFLSKQRVWRRFEPSQSFPRY